MGLHSTGGVNADEGQRATLATAVRDIRFVAMDTPFHMINFIAPEACADAVAVFAAEV